MTHAAPTPAGGADILVTGAGGFLGSHLTARLAGRGEHVRALVPPHEEARYLESFGVEIFRGDVRDPVATDSAASGCRLVYHLASRTQNVGGRMRDFKRDNVHGTACVARAALRVGAERLVLASSSAVYGRRRDHSINEETEARPSTPYGKSKLLAERAALERHSVDGLPVVVARIVPVLGARARSWLGLFQAVASGRFRLIGSGNGLHHPAGVADIVDGLMLCAERGLDGRSYVLAGKEPVSLRRMMELIAADVRVELGPATPAPPLVVYRLAGKLVPDVIPLPRLDRVEFFLNDRACDISRARAELGYAPRVGIRDAIRETGDWYRAGGQLPALDPT